MTYLKSDSESDIDTSDEKILKKCFNIIKPNSVLIMHY